MFQPPAFAKGWLVLLLLAITAYFLGSVLPAFGGITIVLLLSISLGNVREWSAGYFGVFQYAEKQLLAMATMLLGFGLNLQLLAELSPLYLVVLTAMVLLSLLSSQWFCRGMSPALRWLLGAGNGICGNSAIAATAPVVRANKTEIGLAVAVVNLLGTLGIFLFPLLAKAFALNHAESALLVGGILQSVGHVVAAGFSIDAETGTMALLLKMGRILLLGPVIFFVGIRFNKGKQQSLSFKLVPNYVWGFLIAALITSSGWVPEPVTKGFEKAGTYLLLLAMAGIGLGIQFKQLISMGPKAALSGSLIFVTQITALLGFLLLARLF
jgi:uncharacterized integral membrane protein (TIGR00698 family)